MAIKRETTRTITDALSQPQLDLLRIIYGPLHSHETWPTLHYVRSEMDHAGHDADEVLRSMPVVGMQATGYDSYSLVWYDYQNPSPGSVVRLTIAAALHLPEYQGVAEFFVKALGVLVERVRMYRPSPVGVDDATITASELQDANVQFTEAFIRVFPDLIRFEPFGLTGSFQGGQDGYWRLELKRSLLKFEGISTVKQYVELVAERLVKITPTVHKMNVSRMTNTGNLGELFMAGLGPVSTYKPLSDKKEPPAMPGFDARLFTLLIASPGDTNDERDIVEQVALEVNASQMRAHRRGLHPLRWERDAVAGFGDGAQSVINKDGDTADIVVALFRAKVGSPTLSHESGTVEEIERAVERGVPVHVIFLNYGVRISDIDDEQLRRLREWQAKLQKRALFVQVENEDHLRERLRHFLESDLNRLGRSSQDGERLRSSRVRWNAQMTSQSKGIFKLQVMPTGEASNVRVRIVPDQVIPEGMSLPVLHHDGSGYLTANRLPPNQPILGVAMVSGRTVPSFDIQVTWIDSSGDEQSETITVFR